MKSVFVFVCLVAATACAFQVSPPSLSFTGRATSVYYNREALRPKLSHINTGPVMGILPPVFKKLGLRRGAKQGDDETGSTLGIVVPIRSTSSATSSSSSTERMNGDSAAVEQVKQVAVVDPSSSINRSTNGSTNVQEEEEEQTESQKMMQQVKDAGLAGIISYALWEIGFWAVSVPVCIFGYREVTGHWPDFQNAQDMEKLGAEAFAFVNFARFAVPLRIGLALSTTPWIEENIVEVYFKKHAKGEDDENNGSSQ